MKTIKLYLEEQSNEIFYFMNKLNEVEKSMDFYKIKDEIDLFFNEKEIEYSMSKTGNISIRIKPQNNKCYSVVFNYVQSPTFLCSTSFTIKDENQPNFPMQGIYKDDALTIKINTLKLIHKTREYDIFKDIGLKEIVEHKFFQEKLKKEEEFNGYFLTDLDNNYLIIDLKFENGNSFIFRYDKNLKTYDCLYSFQGTPNGFSVSKDLINDELDNLYDVFDLFYAY